MTRLQTPSWDPTRRRLPHALVIGLVAALWTVAGFALPPPLPWVGFLAPTAALALMHRPRWGLYVLLAVLPHISTQTGRVSQLGNYLLPGLILASFGLRDLWAHRSPPRLPRDVEAWFVCVLLAVTWSACFSAYSRALTPVVQVSFLGLFLMAVNREWNPEAMRRGYWVYVAALIPVAAYGLWLVQTVGLTALFFSAGQPQRLQTFYASSNTMGVYLAHGIVIGMAYILAPRQEPWTLLRSLRTMGAAAVVVFLGAALVGTFSRGAMLYVAVAGLTLLWLHRKTLISAAAAVIAVALYALISPPLWLSTLLRLDSGVTHRDSLWHAGWELFKAHPWTGVGLGTTVFEAYRGAYLSGSEQVALASTTSGGAHNFFLQKGAQLGVAGFVLSGALVVLALRLVPRGLRAYRDRSWVFGAAAAGVTGMIARSFFESGGLMSQGRINDSLMFFLFVLTLAWLRGRAEASSG